MFDDINNNSSYYEKSKKATGSLQGWANHYEKLFSAADEEVPIGEDMEKHKEAYKEIADREGFTWDRIEGKDIAQLEKEVPGGKIIAVARWQNPFGVTVNAVRVKGNNPSDTE